MKECIYQNSRGHSTSGIVGEIVTLSPGFGSVSLEVLRGRRAHLMGHGFLGLWGGGGGWEQGTQGRQKGLKKRWIFAAEARAGGTEETGTSWKAQEQEKRGRRGLRREITNNVRQMPSLVFNKTQLSLLNGIHPMLGRAQSCDHTATCSKQTDRRGIGQGESSPEKRLTDLSPTRVFSFFGGLTRLWEHGGSFPWIFLELDAFYREDGGSWRQKKGRWNTCTLGVWHAVVFVLTICQRLDLIPEAPKVRVSEGVFGWHPLLSLKLQTRRCTERLERIGCGCALQCVCVDVLDPQR